jgi:hypothetical protein
MLFLCGDGDPRGDEIPAGDRGWWRKTPRGCSRGPVKFPPRGRGWWLILRRGIPRCHLYLHPCRHWRHSKYHSYIILEWTAAIYLLLWYRQYYNSQSLILLNGASHVFKLVKWCIVSLFLDHAKLLTIVVHIPLYSNKESSSIYYSTSAPTSECPWLLRPVCSDSPAARASSVSTLKSELSASDPLLTLLGWLAPATSTPARRSSLSGRLEDSPQPLPQQHHTACASSPHRRWRRPTPPAHVSGRAWPCLPSSTTTLVVCTCNMKHSNATYIWNRYNIWDIRL